MTVFGIVVEIFENEVFDQIPNTYLIKYIRENTFKYKKYCILFEYLFGIWVFDPTLAESNREHPLRRALQLLAVVSLP